MVLQKYYNNNTMRGFTIDPLNPAKKVYVIRILFQIFGILLNKYYLYTPQNKILDLPLNTADYFRSQTVFLIVSN